MNDATERRSAERLRHAQLLEMISRDVRRQLTAERAQRDDELRTARLAAMRPEPRMAVEN